MDMTASRLLPPTIIFTGGGMLIKMWVEYNKDLVLLPSLHLSLCSNTASCNRSKADVENVLSYTVTKSSYPSPSLLDDILETSFDYVREYVSFCEGHSLL